MYGGGDQVLPVTCGRIRKVSGANVGKIVNILEGKNESKDNGLLKVMSGRKKTPGKKIPSTLAPVKKIMKKKNTPKNNIKNPSVKKVVVTRRKEDDLYKHC